MGTRLLKQVQQGLLVGKRVRGGRALFFARLAVWRAMSAAGLGATVPFRRYEARFYCPPSWRGMAKMAYTLREHCELELLRLDRWVKGGDLVIDVGAHYGTYTVPLARLVGPTGRVVAVEPSTHALPVLHRNIQINGFSNVEVVEAGAGELPGDAILHLHPDPSQASLNDFAEDDGPSEKVRLVRLDDLAPPGRRVAFLKVDVEGYELPALRGAHGLLTRDRPVVLFELLPESTVRGGFPPYGAWDFLAELGYRFEAVDPATGLMVPVAHPDQAPGVNLLAIPDGQVMAS